MKLKKLLKLKQLFISFIICIPSVNPVLAKENWRVTVDTDPLTKRPVCLMESAQHIIDDGQTKTPVTLIYNGQALFAVTRSKIDLTYPGVGLRVDKKAVFRVDSLHKQKIAVFSNQTTEIHSQFIEGLKATLSLGFWPTWPKSETRVVVFNLIGYTKAFEQFEKCRMNGGVGTS